MAADVFEGEPSESFLAAFGGFKCSQEVALGVAIRCVGGKWSGRRVSISKALAVRSQTSTLKHVAEYSTGKEPVHFFI